MDGGATRLDFFQFHGSSPQLPTGPTRASSGSKKKNAYSQPKNMSSTMKRPKRSIKMVFDAHIITPMMEVETAAAVSDGPMRRAAMPTRSTRDDASPFRLAMR